MEGEERKEGREVETEEKDWRGRKGRGKGDRGREDGGASEDCICQVQINQGL